jgi:hypothetical protein
MAEFQVPVEFTIQGMMTINAQSEEDAIEQAQSIIANADYEVINVNIQGFDKHGHDYIIVDDFIGEYDDEDDEDY